ncbi:MAG: undecaprenyl-diphosphate phosphatase [Verrucomicrobiota bacterium]|nr:undecaprenyl-diphosphate phosphatase [Verrucomicrobiota bacterium]
MPEWLAVLILGVIEGITEFLPISSTGHMLLAQNWLPYKQSEVFIAVVQSGAVLAVLMVFTERLKQIFTRLHEPETRLFLLKLGTAFMLTVMGGLTLKKLDFRLQEDVVPIAWATLIGGVLILVIEASLRNRELRNEVTWRVAIAIGIGQLLAIIFPGLSRSGSTILMGLAMGIKRPAVTEFSFLLGIPTLLSAGALEIVSALKNPQETGPVDWGMLAFGSVVAAVTAFIVVRWLLKYVQTHTFNIFGWYRIVLGALILLLAKTNH